MRRKPRTKAVFDTGRLVWYRNSIDKVVKELHNINSTLEKMPDAMKKPEHPFMKVLTAAGVGVSVLGIIQVIDTIVEWF